MKSSYKADSITLAGAIAMGTGVMIGAGIFALTGQIAELAGPLFPLSFVLGAMVSGFSAHAYIKMSNAFPSAGGVAMILQKAYGRNFIAVGAALLMVLSMVISESLVARTFGSYALRGLQIEDMAYLVPVLGVGLIVVAYVINASGNRSVGLVSTIMSTLKIGGIVVFGVAAIWASGISLASTGSQALDRTTAGFLGSVALAILAFTGFTTITNSGAEITEPHRNVGRSIIWSIGTCIAVYLLVALAVGSSLTLAEIVEAKDYSLAEAARPAFGDAGLYLTVLLSVIATASGLIASIFAVSRMLAMLTEMHLIPHRHFGLPGGVRDHTLIYTVVIATFLTIFFDLGRIASLGAFFYLVMDVIIQWGVFRHLRQEIGASAPTLLVAIGLDVVVLGAFASLKWYGDPEIVIIALTSIVAVFAWQRFYLSRTSYDRTKGHRHL
ncbi:APC family permease [Jannaschia rubra]|uniref:APC family permease n=1 Tax=Jannaschia rubra TaxID=282197 RepID=UPI002493499C|nr:APC family permease [Jannaschia rubra]